MDFWLLYLMTRTEKLSESLDVFAVVSALVAPFALLGTSMAYSLGDASKETMALTQKWTKRIIISAVIAGLLSALLPSRKDWYLIVGGYYVTHIEGIDKLPKDTVAAIDEFLKQYGKEPEKKQGHGV